MSASRTILDSFDRALLAIVQEDMSTPMRMMAERINLSTAAVQRRLRRLETTGVIQRNVAVIDPTHVGRPITIIVEVQIHHANRLVLDGLKARFSIPAVQQCYYVTGDADFMLVLNVATMAEYEDLARELFYDNVDVKWFRTIVVMDRVKTGLTVPLD